MNSNLRQIYELNQRGGRLLSMVDLLQANTVDLEVAAYLAGAAASGASLLTAARPGNAGKTTLLAGALAFLPPERRLVTLADTRLLTATPPGSCLLAHEIGSGPYYAYLWGADARRFFEATAAGHSVASCIHADTLDELREILCGPPLGVSPEAFARVDVIAFLRLERQATGYRRRVAAVYEATGAPGETSHRLLFRWEARGDHFVAEAPPRRWKEATARAREILEQACAQGVAEFGELYARAQGEAEI